jgi:hypothetical protein
VEFAAFQEKIRKFTGFTSKRSFQDYVKDFGANVLVITQVNERLIAKTCNTCNSGI